MELDIRKVQAAISVLRRHPRESLKYDDGVKIAINFLVLLTTWFSINMATNYGNICHNPGSA